MSTRRLKIAIYAEKIPPSGGGIAAAHYSLYQLLKDTHEVKLFAFVDHDQSSTEHIVRGRDAPVLGKILEWLLVRYVRRYEPQGYIDACRKIARTAAVIRGMNRELSNFGPDIVLVSDDRLPVLAMKKPSKAKLVWMAHHNYSRFRSQPLVNGPCDYDLFLAHRLERRAVRRCDQVIFVSRYMEQVFRETLDKELPGTVIPNFLELSSVHSASRTAIRKEMGVEAQTVLVLVPSGGTEVKGARFLPEVIRRLCQQKEKVAFYVPGHIDSKCQVELNYLRSKITIITPGAVSQAENIRNASACDLCISPALIENYSFALVEALALGLPCVTFDVGGNQELVADGVAGYVVDFLDVDSLCQRSLDLIQNEVLRKKFSTAASAYAKQLCVPQRILGQYNDLFVQLSEEGE